MDSLVLSPCLYCGWFAPCGVFLESLRQAPWYLQVAHPKAAGLRHLRLRFLLIALHCFAPYLATLGNGIFGNSNHSGNCGNFSNSSSTTYRSNFSNLGTHIRLFIALYVGGRLKSIESLSIYPKEISHSVRYLMHE